MAFSIFIPSKISYYEKRYITLFFGGRNVLMNMIYIKACLEGNQNSRPIIVHFTYLRAGLSFFVPLHFNSVKEKKDKKKRGEAVTL